MTKAVHKKKSKVKFRPKKQLTRKELRKQKQQEKKETKRIFFSSKTQGKQLVAEAKVAKLQNNSSNKKNSKKKAKTKGQQLPVEEISTEQLLSGAIGSDDDESIESDFSDAEVDARMPVKKQQPQTTTKKPKLQAAPRIDAAESHRRELLRQKDLQNASRKQRVKQLVLENEEEDKMIAKLEKKLKLNKSKDKNRLVRKMFNDGLDYALEFCLNDEDEKAKQLLKEKRKQQKQQNSGDWSEEDIEDVAGFNDDDQGSENDFNENEEMSGTNSENGGDDLGSVESEDDGNENKETFKEDIYGRKRDKDGNVIQETPSNGDVDSIVAQPQKYIPPHLRAKQSTEENTKQAELLQRLRRSCKGLLNRLSEANLHKICNGIEELFMKNSRFNMNETLTALLSESLIGRTMTNERMVQEHMVLLAYLHAQVGSEIGAHFLQTFVEQFDKYIKDLSTLSVEDKRLNNLILLLAYMYIFKIYEHRLLLEIIAKLADNLCEKSIECLLLIFQSVGFKLRKDDPMAFKQMMLSVQQKIADAPLEMKENLRLKFMVDILNAVKNNNINKIPQFDPELAENLRKRLKAMLRNDKYVITLNITLDDLLRADQVGKWWIVGSAWSGNISDVGAATQAHKNDPSSLGAQRFSEKLLTLAKKQKMNTEERRNIFCIIMSADDYVDAFEKILHLSLKDQRSIAYVIIHCCLNEARPNPYYAHLALKFCNYNRKFQLAFQFATWDRINEIDALSKQQIKNMAKLLLHLILNGGMVLSVLKVVDFLQLDKLSFMLMKEIMVGLLLATDENETRQAFERVAKNQKLNQFKNSIRLFMQHFLLKNEGANLKLEEGQLELLKRRVDYVDKLLSYVDL